MTARYELIDAEKANHAVRDMCLWLGMSRSGYYEWRIRPATAERRKLTAMGIRQSVGRTGVCWDNALAESFFSIHKNERLNRFTFASRAKARRQFVRYIEGFYDHRRLRSGLGYRNPLLDQRLR
ncbi:integrase core domain-containing protein [Actinocorallia sp. B10E7]|uniref:integrase core domain-containing protein n=1 Tax=Actinocorallia sp. B10E7 TaxID=3153558 RepID=UPI00325CBD92